MGMSLFPADESSTEALDYNWGGWMLLQRYLLEWGVDIREFDDLNDGKLISSETCLLVADALEKNLENVKAEYRPWLVKHPEKWRELAACGGARQF